MCFILCNIFISFFILFISIKSLVIIFIATFSPVGICFPNLTLPNAPSPKVSPIM